MMKNHTSHQIDDNLEMKNGLSISEIHEGLSALQKKEFPMRLLTKWVKSPTENGYLDWIDITQKNIFYKQLVQSEHDLIQTLPHALTDLENIQKIQMHSEEEPYIKKLIDEHKYLGYIENIVDIGCGDGTTLKVLFDHLYKTHNDEKNLYPMTLIDASGLAVQNASATFPKNPKTQIIGDVFDENTNLLGNRKNYHTLFTSLGRGYGNLNIGERRDLRTKLGPRGKFLISVFKVPTTQEQYKNSLKAYGDNSDGDNHMGYEVCKKQVWHMLEVLGFTQTDLSVCDFVVKWGEPDKHGNMNIYVGFQSTEPLEIHQGQKKYIYETNTFYPMYQSERFTKKYFSNKVQNQYNGGDKIFAIYENNDSMLIIEDLQQTKNAALKKKIKLGVVTILAALGLQQGADIFTKYSENTSDLPQEVIANTQQLLYARGIYNTEIEKDITKTLPKIINIFYGGFNYHPHAKLDFFGTDPISQKEKNTVLIPIVQNDLIKLAENNYMYHEISPKNLYNIIGKIVDNNPTLFQKDLIEKPEGWLKDIDNVLDEQCTQNASAQMKNKIYSLLQTISFEDNIKCIRTLNKMNREKYQTYDFDGNEIVVYQIPIKLLAGETQGGANDARFLLCVPIDGSIKNYKTRHDILGYSQKQATEMENLKYHFKQAMYGVDIGM